MSARTDPKEKEDLQRLMEWLRKQPHLPQDIDERILLAYIHGTKSLEIAKQKLDAYFTCKSKEPYYFTFPGRDPDDAAFKRGCEALKLFILPKLTPERYVIVMSVFDMDISKFSHTQYVSRVTMLVDLGMLEWSNAEGAVFICDLAGLDASILTKLSIPASAFLLPWFEMTVTTEDVTATKELFPAQLLPCDFGGLEKSSTDLNNFWIEKLQKNRDWFEKTNEQVVDETKRPPDINDIYGIKGTFRTLNVD